jgi:hypothetical protein
MANELREQAADQYEQAADELAAAADHLRITARRFRADDMASGCAHAWAARGHMLNADTLLNALAVLHASRAQR